MGNSSWFFSAAFTAGERGESGMKTLGFGVIDGAMVRTAAVCATQVWAHSMFWHCRWCSTTDSLMARLVRIFAVWPQWGHLILM